jgi:hypothetical protein
MKKSIILMLFIMLAITGCKKDSKDNNKNSGPATLLSKVYNGAFLYAEFTYNGKQLVKAVRYINNFEKSSITHSFTYDANGHVAKDNVTYYLYGYSDSDISDATFTYSGDNISKIDIKFVPSIWGERILPMVFTYQNNKPSHLSYAGQEIDYTYDSNGNQNLSTLIIPGNTYHPGVYTTTNVSFDTNHNVSNTLPFSLYFSYINDFDFLPMRITGPNNVIKSNVIPSELIPYTITYKYDYDSNGYPSKMTSTTNIINLKEYNFSYKYIEVN